MRRLTIASCLLMTIGCTTSLTACSGTESAEPESTAANGSELRLQLQTDKDGNLRLEGTSLNARYVGIYPNPDRWSAIDFVIDHTGIPTTRCTRDGIVTECSETPFFVEIKRAERAAASGGSLAIRTTGTPDGSGPAAANDSDGSEAPDESSAPPPPASNDGGVTVIVTDTHGEKVAEKTIPPAQSGGSTPPAGSTCGGAAVGGAPGQGGFSKNGTAQACEAASLEDKPGCDMSTVAEAAKKYCDTVNAQLPAADKIDCAVLTNPGYVPTPLPTARGGGDCSTYWEPARAAVEGFRDCQKVSLLLTQWRDRARHELIANGVCRSSPLVLDLDGDGIHLSSLADGVSFDLLGGGEKVRASWTDGKDAFLALDRNANGEIDGASELFGNATGDRAFTDGFAALGELDDDGNGMIDARDAAFGHLVLWRDANRDGVSTPLELTTLREAGVRRLSITAVRKEGPSSLDVHGNAIPLVAEFERTDGRRGMLVDAFLRFKPTAR